jgi:mevalonate kinase
MKESNLSCTVSVPGVIHPLGEYSSIFNYPGFTCAIHRRLQVEVKPSEFEFSVVDGYKLEPFKQKMFYTALEKFWPDHGAEPMEFITKSNLPLSTAISTPSSLALAITTALYELRKQKKSKQENNPELVKKHYNKPFLFGKATSLESSFDDLFTPLNITTSVTGGTIVSNSDDKTASVLWPLDGEEKSQKQMFAHRLDIMGDLTFVLGFLKGTINSKFFGSDMLPLFDDPVIYKQTKEPSVSKKSYEFKVNYDSIPWKLHRFIEKSGFARDNVKDLGSLVRMALDPLKTGNLVGLGKVMDKQQNLLTILGVHPKELKPLFDAASEDSYGVSIVGTNDNAILSLPKDPETVVNKISDAGGEAIIVKTTNEGIKYN